MNGYIWSCLLAVLTSHVGQAGAVGVSCSPCDCSSYGTVDCSDKNLTSLPPSLPTDFDEYLLSGNPSLAISVDSFQPFTAMKTLYLPESGVPYYDKQLFQNNINLAEVVFPDRKIFNINPQLFVSRTTTLTNIRNLNVAEVPPRIFHGLDYLETLHLETAQTELEAMMFNTETDKVLLQELVLVGNSLTALPEDLLTNATQLEKLTLKINSVKAMPAKFLRDCVSLKSLTIEGAKLSIGCDVMPNSYRLETVIGSAASLEACAFTNIEYPGSIVLSNVKSLTCAGDVTESKNILNQLSVTHCGLTQLSDGCVAFLPGVDRIANFSHNLISSLEVNGDSNAKPLPVLDLSYNQISTVSESALELFSYLTHLYLQHNNISVVPRRAFEPLEALTEIRLDHNMISVLPADLFDSNTNLEIIGLSHNHIVIIPDLLLNSLKRLENFYIHFNQIKILQRGLLSSPMLKVANISYNNLTTLEDGFIPRGLECSPTEVIDLSNQSTDLLCECSLLPVLRCNIRLEGTCNQPYYLQNKALGTLTKPDICPLSDKDMIVAESFTSNGTHISVRLADDTDTDQVEMIERLTHNGTHLVIAQYVVPTDLLIIHPESGGAEFSSAGQTVFNVPAVSLPLLYEDDNLILTLSDSVHISLNNPNSTVTYDDNNSIIVDGNVGVEIKLPDTSVRWDDKTVSFKIGDTDIFNFKVPANSTTSITPNSVALSKPNETNPLQVNTHIDTLSLNDEGVLSISGGTSVEMQVDNLLPMVRDRRLVFLDEQTEKIQVASDLEHITINRRNIELESEELNVEMELAGDVHINNGTVSIKGTKGLTLAVLNTDNSNMSYWNGSHLTMGFLIVEAGGIMLLRGGEAELHESTNRSLYMKSENNTTAVWNGTHIILHQGDNGSFAVFDVKGIPVYSDGKVVFELAGSGERTAIIDVPGMVPIFRDNTVQFIGNHSIMLVADGHLTLNDSHIIVKRSLPDSDDVSLQEVDREEGELVGVYTAPGYSTFNSTHVVKREATTNKTTALVSVSRKKNDTTAAVSSVTISNDFVIRLHVQDDRTLLQMPGQNFTYTPPSVYDGSSIKMDTSSYNADGVADIYNSSFVVIDGTFVTYLITLEEVIEVISTASTLDPYTRFNNNNMTLLSIRAPGQFQYRDKTILITEDSKPAVRIYPSFFSYPLNITFLDRGTIQFGALFSRVCESESNVVMNFTELALVNTEGVCAIVTSFSAPSSADFSHMQAINRMIIYLTIFYW